MRTRVRTRACTRIRTYVLSGVRTRRPRAPAPVVAGDLGRHPMSRSRANRPTGTYVYLVSGARMHGKLARKKIINVQRWKILQRRRIRASRGWPKLVEGLQLKINASGRPVGKPRCLVR